MLNPDSYISLNGLLWKNTSVMSEQAQEDKFWV